MKQINILFYLILLILTVSISYQFTLLSSLDDVQGCKATSVKITLFDNNKPVLNYSLTISISSSNFGQELFLTDVKYSSLNSSMYSPTNGLSPTISIDFTDPQKCIGGQCSFLIYNSTYSINFPFTVNNVDGYEKLIINVVDEGSISDKNGSMFLNNSCTFNNYSSSISKNITYTVNQCCIKYRKVNQFNNSSTPLCQKFNNSITFYKNDIIKFVQIYTDLSYNDKNKSFELQIMDSGIDFINFYEFTFNGQHIGCRGPPGTRQFCSFKIDNFEDFKTLFQIIINSNYGIFTSDIGRIISRNEVLLKEEGMRYLPSNPCQYMFNSFYYSNTSIFSKSQFCCSSFSS